MNIKIIITATAIAFVLALPQEARSEFIFLKDGDIKSGTIINETAVSVTLREKNGRVQTYPQNKIMRILFTDLYMGKVLVRLTNGKSIEAFMVGEDEKAYTFRKELYKPEEFKIPRGEVLFMTRSNPVNLKGRPYETKIRLTWSPPYKPPESYNVYIKRTKQEEYKRIGSTRKEKFTARGLDKKSSYFFIVKGVDAFGKESLPSNEIKATTNRPPLPPTSGKCKMGKTRDGKKLKITLSWKYSAQADIKIGTQKFRIYRESVSGLSQIGETDKNSFSVEGLNPKKKHYFIVRSVNMAGNESDDLWISTSMLKFDIGFSGAFMVPFGYLGTVMEVGYGGYISGSLRNVFTTNFDLGIETGFFYLMGRTERLSKGYIIPFYGRLNYRFILYRTLTLTPGLYIGMHYNNLTYLKKGYIFNINSELKFQYLQKIQKKTFEPVALAGLSLSYRFKKLYIIRVSTDYGIYIKKGNLTNFLRINVGMSFWLDVI